MKNNTLYASDITYEFEKARIKGSNSAQILENLKREMDEPYQRTQNTLMILMIKIQVQIDDGEIQLNSEVLKT